MIRLAAIVSYAACILIYSSLLDHSSLRYLKLYCKLLLATPKSFVLLISVEKEKVASKFNLFQVIMKCFKDTIQFIGVNFICKAMVLLLSYAMKL